MKMHLNIGKPASTKPVQQSFDSSVPSIDQSKLSGANKVKVGGKSSSKSKSGIKLMKSKSPQSRQSRQFQPILNTALTTNPTRQTNTVASSATCNYSHKS